MMKIFGMELKLLPLFLLVLSGCEVDPVSNPENLDWSINTDYLRQGCFSGKDCIPSLENPLRSPVGGEDLEYLDDGDLVVGVWDGQEYSAYPHPILDWHEIVNEDGFTISYCPLTGSAIHLKAEEEYGVSGLLYNSNLIMYDRSTGSYWPQMLLHSDAGSLKGTELELKPLVETSWGVWRRLFPETKVVNANTGYSRNYSRYPYGSYRSCNSTTCGDYIYFPIRQQDQRLPAKERVLAIITPQQVKVYPIKTFSQPILLRESVGGQTYSIVISEPDNIAVAFKTERTLSIATWDITGEKGSILLDDAENGNSWNILGQAVNGTAAGGELTAARAYIAYWFALAAFFPEVEIYT